MQRQIFMAGFSMIAATSMAMNASAAWLECDENGQAWQTDSNGQWQTAGGCAGGPWCIEVELVNSSSPIQIENNDGGAVNDDGILIAVKQILNDTPLTPVSTKRRNEFYLTSPLRQVALTQMNKSQNTGMFKNIRKVTIDGSSLPDHVQRRFVAKRDAKAIGWPYLLAGLLVSLGIGVFIGRRSRGQLS